MNYSTSRISCLELLMQLHKESTTSLAFPQLCRLLPGQSNVQPSSNVGAKSEGCDAFLILD